MRFGRRGTTARRASYAAIVGDRYLWVALAETDEVSLRGVAVPVETDGSQPGHHGSRLDLVALAPGRHGVVTSGGRALLGPEVRVSGPGTALALERDADGHLHVVRRPPTEGASVRAVRLRGERVEIDLDGAGSAVELRLGRDRSVPLVDGTAVLSPPDLDETTPGDLGLSVDGRPVRRRANDLADPGSGALLPALHPAGAADALARLRWSADGTLVLRVLRVLREPG